MEGYAAEAIRKAEVESERVSKHTHTHTHIGTRRPEQHDLE